MEYNILFIDNNLENCKETFAPFFNNYHSFFVSSSNEALFILKNINIDVCLINYDIKQPSAAEILSRIKKSYPEIVRIIFSDKNHEEFSIRSFNLAHQFLAIPDNIETIKEKIEIPLILKNLIRNEDTLKKLNGEDGIPALPELYYKIEKEIFSPDTSIHRVINLISKDIALTTKIFQLANSAYFGVAAKITDIYQAVNILGLNIIKSVILYTKVFSLLEKKPELKEIIESIWNHSLVVSNISHKLASHFTGKRETAEESYIAGILHDIGKIIILNMINKNPYFMKHEIKNAYLDDEAAKNILGATHSEIGAYALALWGFPKRIIDAVLLHHSTPIIQEDFSTS
ncbi:MAG: response regulator, partial [Melioribacter sp.]|nr:response regulator [Melioribacter sp.]